MRPFNRQRKSPDAASNGSGHGHQEVPQVPEPTLQPVTARPNVGAVERMQIELGITPAELAAERVEDARTELREGMKYLDSSEDRDLHVALGEVVNAVDNLRARLGERGRS